MTTFRIGIDTGGTFTDLIRFDTTTGEIQSLKVASTPREPLQAFICAICEAGAQATAISGLVHGTTVVTNALIEPKGAWSKNGWRRGWAMFPSRSRMRLRRSGVNMSDPAPPLPMPF